MLTLPIETKRLLLRELNSEDIAAFHHYRSDPVLARYQGWEPMSVQACREFLDQQTGSLESFGQDGQWLQLAITRKETHELLGDIGMCSLSRREGLLTLGFTLSQRYQGQGFATEAIRGLLNHLCSTTPFCKIQAITDLRNTASIRLLTRLGFQLQGTKDAFFKGEACKEQVYLWENHTSPE